MGISISGSNAISGLGGQDTDFDKVLSQLKQIESTQLNRLEAWKSDWNLRYEAFTQIIEQIQAASSMLSQLSDKNNFVTKLVQSTNDSVITAVANASAQDVQHNIKVTQMASNSIWANTGHIFESKTDVINTTGQEQYFNYSYAGKDYSFKVPANTTLDSFVSMINNSADNPGIKVSLIQAGNGYVFQVAGKDTGQANDLVIYDSNLVGMSALNSTSTWQTNSTMAVGSTLTDPNSYVFDLVLANGSTKSVTVKGNLTAQELVTALNNAAGGINASLDPSGNLEISGVKSFSRRLESEKAYKPASTKLNVPGGISSKLNAEKGLAEGLADDDLLSFTLTLDDDSTRVVQIKAGATRRDLLVALAQATQSGDSVEIDGSGVKLDGVKGVSFDLVHPDPDNPDPDKTQIIADNQSRLTTTVTAATGVKDAFGGTLTSASLKIKVSSDKLSDRIDGGQTGDTVQDLTFTLVKQDGTALNIYGLKSDMSNQDLIDKVKETLDAEGISYTEADGVLSIDGAREFKLSGGGIKNPAWETDATTKMVIPATNPDSSGKSLFYTDPKSGAVTLEKAPDLVYTIKTNDGNTGTLTLPSGSSMKSVLAALKYPGGVNWTWTGADGNSTAAPSTLGAKYLDPDGNEYLNADGTSMKLADIESQNLPVTLHLDNVQTFTGPGMSGQVATSTNWSIQRSSNARYYVDNWPIEMESETNKISDVIEGVVFTIQDEGDARISVSTDITSVEQSIQNFLDAVNSVLLTVNDLMKYDENKQTTSNDPNDIGNDNYSPSGLTSQKGSLLTGNYGVQLFKSRFSSVLGSAPPGFKSRTSAEDVLSGDVLATLANMGIKTDTDSTSDTYGLLVMAPSSSIAEIQSMDKENYSNMITNQLEAVVDFFCSSGTGSSTSTDFRYGSHVNGITKAGTYEVRYNVAEDGTITDVTVGGVPAKRDESQPGNYYSVASGDARGLSILIDDLTVGAHPPAGEEPMYVRIKQGLVQTTNQFLKDELVFNDVNIPANATPSEIADAVALKSKNGALMSLRDNYLTVMEGIDAKIEREQRRISTWESRQKKIFANLETLLKSYEQQQKQLEGQLAQLSND